MKNKNQQIISLLKKENLELRDVLKRGAIGFDEQQEVNSRLRETLKESMDHLYKFQAEGKEVESIMEEQEKQISKLEKQVGGLLEIIANREVPDGFVINPPKMITPENLEDCSIFEDI